MRDQYAGDISDMLKLALLRTVAGDDRTVGVGWYYNPVHDDRVDGCHRIDFEDPRLKFLDPVLFNALTGLPERSVTALESLPIWPPKTRFHRTPVPSTRGRHSWAEEMKSFLREAAIVFLDPDNGLGKISERHTTVKEIALMRKPGRAVVVIKFPERQEHDRQVEGYHGFLQQTGAVSIVTIRTTVCVRVTNKGGLHRWIPRDRWFTILDADDVVAERTREFALRLKQVEKCMARVQEAPIKVANSAIAVLNKRRKGEDQITASGVVENVCPECGHQFKGNGFDGIDAHWRAKHEGVMSYKDAWPLIKLGKYCRY
jgi:hypothetical protein